MIRIFIETSTMVGTSLVLSSPLWKSILSQGENTEVEIMTSRICLDELCNRYESDTLTQYKNYERSSGALSDRLQAGHGLGFQEQQIRAHLSDHRRRIERKMLEGNVTILDYPKTSHKQIVERQLRRAKPSKYRDTLIWCSVLEELERNNEPIVLVTRDFSDFAERKGGEIWLHPDLTQDLLDRGLKEGAVTIESDLSRVAREYLEDYAERIEEIEAAVMDGTFQVGDFAVNPKEYVWSFLESIPAHTLLSAAGVTLDADAEIIDVREIDSRITGADARRLNSGEIQVVATAVSTFRIKIGLEIFANVEGPGSDYVSATSEADFKSAETISVSMIFDSNLENIDSIGVFSEKLGEFRLYDY
jgi:hypothetical protein